LGCGVSGAAGRRGSIAPLDSARRAPDHARPVGDAWLRGGDRPANAAILPAVDSQLYFAGGRGAAERDLPDRVAAVFPAIWLLPGSPGRFPGRRGTARGAAL